MYQYFCISVNISDNNIQYFILCLSSVPRFPYSCTCRNKYLEVRKATAPQTHGTSKRLVDHLPSNNSENCSPPPPTPSETASPDLPPFFTKVCKLSSSRGDWLALSWETKCWKRLQTSKLASVVRQCWSSQQYGCQSNVAGTSTATSVSESKG